MEINFAEWFNILFFALIALLACIRPLPRLRRTKACVMGAFGIGICFLMILSPLFFSRQISFHMRHWLPMALILLAYHQSGQLFNAPWTKFQSFLMDLDRRLLGRFYRGAEVVRLNSFLSQYFEISYIACYLLVPAALGVLILMGFPDRIDEFWIIVLTSTYTCYALIPFFPAFPPRLLNAGGMTLEHPDSSRAVNLWILRYWSIQANTFPSAHVSACTAASLVLIKYDMLIGACFLWISLSIAVAVVVRRYHYLADAVLGVLVPLIFFLLLSFR